MECVTTVNYYIVINGESTLPFDAARGLPQRDPISPFLFAIIMEYLSRSLITLKEEKQFKYHPRCSKLNITHLCFANDLLMFAKGEKNQWGSYMKSLVYLQMLQGYRLINLRVLSIMVGFQKKASRKSNKQLDIGTVNYHSGI
ncbi:uncharacterized protein [Nicotiana sylvestris]|uniref:uncharacterized protein n=1 Tax=Nicotiana sylvestris TaxID=4096 RepID=UPI00388C736B